MKNRLEAAEAIIERQKMEIDDLRRENMFLRARIEDEKAEKLAAIEEAKNFFKNTPNCNNCGLKKVCKYLPVHCETVRYNCFLWEEERE